MPHIPTGNLVVVDYPAEDKRTWKFSMETRTVYSTISLVGDFEANINNEVTFQ